MFIGGSRYRTFIFSGLSLSRPVDTKHYSDSVFLFLRQNNSPANIIKLSVAISTLLVFHCLIDATAINRRR